MSILKERLKQSDFQSAGQEAVLSLIAAASTVRNKINLICHERNISIAQYNILKILKGSYPLGYPRSEISSRMVEKSPDITRIIDRMVRTGLVERKKSEDDMRQSIAKITEKGISLLFDLNTTIQSFQVDFQNRISEKQCKILSGICDEILLLGEG